MTPVTAIRVAPDLGSWVLFPATADKIIYLVGSPKIDKYLTVPANRHPLVMGILDRLRLGYSPEQIETDLKDQGQIVNVCEFCRMLAKKNIIEWEGVDMEAPTGVLDVAHSRWAASFGHLRALSWQIFRINLDVYRPFLDRISRTALIVLIMGAILTSVGVAMLGGVNMAYMRQLVAQVFEWQRFLWLTVANVLLMPVFVLLHEASHAIAASRGGVYPRQLSFRLYMLSMAYFSLQLPGLYTLPVRSRFLAIAAGPLMDLTLGNVFLIAARSTSGDVAPWLALLALSNYGRLVFNLLPVMPMTDGYALLSQAVFREIDIRGRATQEYRRWRTKKPNNFKGKYVAFFALNVGTAALIIIGGLWQVNAIALTWLSASGLVPAEHMIWSITVVLLVLDSLCLYLARHRLRVLIGG